VEESSTNIELNETAESVQQYNRMSLNIAEFFVPEHLSELREAQNTMRRLTRRSSSAVLWQNI
jgi:hypothetical protein